MPRFMIALDDTTSEALARWAAEDLRAPADQAAWVLRHAIKTHQQQQEALRRLSAVDLSSSETEQKEGV